MNDKPHIADKESRFLVYNVTPDFCEVDGQITAFEIVRTLDHEKFLYASTVFARGAPVLVEGSVVQGVDGDAGRGVATSTSLQAGDSVVISGLETVLVEGKRVARHDDTVMMNGMG